MLPLMVLALQQPACPRRVDPAVDSAWQAYRRGSVAEAARRFAVADSLCPGLPDVQVGLGFVQLRRNSPGDAAARFLAALRKDSTAADAWYGLGLARARSGQPQEAAVAFRRTLAINPGYGDAEQQLLQLGLDSAVVLPPPVRPAQPAVPARTHGERFEVWEQGAWVPFYVKGVNLGAARPGKFPSEFPTDDSTYAAWIQLIAAAHANVIRLYTIFPPAFYRALKRWNDGHPGQAVWLVHGIWAEPPPGDNYDDPAWLADFHAEMRRVVDVLHGHAALSARPGHAFGRYTADLSNHTLAVIIGREWEPFTIRAYNARPGGRTRYAGRFLAVDSGTAADVWMAEQCDALLKYEWDRYHAQRPIAYTNWPTLDPLTHPTEPTLEEEGVLRQRLGLPPFNQVREYNNDDQSLDAMLVRTTPADLGGYFASYHAYPYYPDFMDYDSTYGAARSSLGPSHYLGYLQDLHRHYAGRPVLIAEYGVPSSRGVAHLQPEGMHHGGHDEAEMAAIDVRLTTEIREAGLAGGIIFAWLDEWFKHNWAVIDFEVPKDRNRLWFSPMDAEQNYGLLGQYAGDSARDPVLGGDPARWQGLPFRQGNDTLQVRVGQNEAYVYLAIAGRAAAAPDSARYLIGIDTYRPDRGEFRLPGVPDSLDTGVEFLLSLGDSSDGGGRLLVARSYNPYLGPRPGMGPTALDPFYNVLCTVNSRSSSGEFDSLFVATNRFRVARTRQIFPARGVDRGRLRYGRERESTLADWYVDRAAGLVEVRIPWGLLNVTDPSSRTIVASVRSGGVVTTTTTDGFRFVGVAVSRASGSVTARLPAGGTFTWPTWEQPTWYERLKPAYFALQRLWGSW
ncbi:MAG TPA: tetratricopeptide repeat protein [Gemmatimonadales bacterium]|nr:tetratricopeptide repeat protein [Gemmatimonadales bacterium]